MSASFDSNAQIELWNNSEKYEKKVYVLPKHLDEKVAMLHLEKVGAKLTKLSKDQADYIGLLKQEDLIGISNTNSKKLDISSEINTKSI